MSSIEMKADLLILSFADAQCLDAWLESHAEAAGLWIKFAKKKPGIVAFDKEQALDVALCHGWIDGQADRCDADHFLMRFTPRRAGSRWSQINCTRVERLESEGRMKPAGRQQVEAAKASGRWQSAYPPPSATEIPGDVAAALSLNRQALAAFEALTRSKRFQLLHAIATVKRPETRVRKIKLLVTILTHKPS